MLFIVDILILICSIALLYALVITIYGMFSETNGTKNTVIINGDNNTVTQNFSETNDENPVHSENQKDGIEIPDDFNEKEANELKQFMKDFKDIL